MIQRDARVGRARLSGLGRLLVALIVAAIVLLLTFVLVRGLQDRGRARVAVREEAQLLAQEVAVGVDQFIIGIERELVMLASDLNVRQGDVGRVEALLQSVREGNPDLENAFLLDTRGVQIASLHPEVRDPDAATRPWFAQALLTGRLALGEPLAYKNSTRTVELFAQRVTGLDGQPAGVLCLSLNIAHLRTLAGTLAAPRPGLTFLLLRNGTILSASDTPERWIGQTLAGTPDVERGRRTNPGPPGGALPDGTEHIMQYQALTNAPWLTLGALSSAPVAATERRTLIWAASGLAVGVPLSLLLAWLVLRGFDSGARARPLPAARTLPALAERPQPALTLPAPGELPQPAPMHAPQQVEIHASAEPALAGRVHDPLQAQALAGVPAVTANGGRTLDPTFTASTRAPIQPGGLDERAALDPRRASVAWLAEMLLEGSRLADRRVTSKLETLALAPLLHGTSASAILETNGTAVRLDVPPDLPAVRADAAQLEDALTALLAQVCRRTPDSPVVLGARPVGNALAVVIFAPLSGRASEQTVVPVYPFGQTGGGPAPVSTDALERSVATAYIEAMGGKVWAAGEAAHSPSFVVRLPLALDALSVGVDLR